MHPGYRAFASWVLFLSAEARRLWPSGRSILKHGRPEGAAMYRGCGSEEWPNSGPPMIRPCGYLLRTNTTDGSPLQLGWFGWEWFGLAIVGLIGRSSFIRPDLARQGGARFLYLACLEVFRYGIPWGCFLSPCLGNCARPGAIWKSSAPMDLRRIFCGDDMA